MIKKYALYFLLSLFSVAVTADQFSTPTDRVKDSVDKVITILKDKSLDKEVQWSRIGLVINDSFDFRSMSQSILATNWKQATPEERQQFVVFFSQYLEDTYRQKFQRYQQQSSIITSQQIRKDRAIVETQILGDGRPILVTYRLKNNDGKWYVYDVLIRGESVVTESRELFDAIVKAEGLEGLKSDLENRVKIYKSKYGELP